jgi:hypothetical protein
MWGTIINTSDNNRKKNDGKDAIGFGSDLDWCGLTGSRMCSSSLGKNWSCTIMRQWSMRGTRITGKNHQNHQHIREPGVGRAGQRSHDERSNRGGITLQTARDIRNCSGSVRGIGKSLCTSRSWFWLPVEMAERFMFVPELAARREPSGEAFREFNALACTHRRACALPLFFSETSR